MDTTLPLPALGDDVVGSGGAAVVLLGAGRPTRGEQPSALADVGPRGRVLDWLLHALGPVAAARVLFVGGYALTEVVKRYPEISFCMNPTWESDGPLGSFLRAPVEPGSTVYVSYTDVVYERDAVTRLADRDADAVVLTDGTWRNRFAGRPVADLARAEKVSLAGDRVTACGVSLDPDAAHAEFAGLVKLGPRATSRAAELARSGAGSPWRRGGLPALFGLLIDEGYDVRAVDVGGAWAELNAPQDLARFVLGTKAGTLARLQPLVRRAVIPDHYSFTVADWREARQHVLDMLTQWFDGSVIIRSSTASEDSWAASNAGAFVSVASVPAHDRQALASAVEAVVASYPSADATEEVLVQKVVDQVAAAGVVMTRSPRTGGPYYVVNYDDVTGRTDLVTSGAGGTTKTAYVHASMHGADAVEPHVGSVLEAARELEALVGHDSLDVEFAVLHDGRVALFQVRPIVADYGEWRAADDDVEAALVEAESELARRTDPGPFIVGDTLCLGTMPDWNPAEILGLKPRQLALSLYQHLVTDEVWAAQRAEFGYRDVRPCPLVVSLAGQPFVDVRASFNSFVPADVDDGVARDMVNHYVDRLREHPDLHDKVEFEVALTCMTFDFDDRVSTLLPRHLGGSVRAELARALRALTAKGVAQAGANAAAVARLEERRERILATVTDPLERAYLLLEDCRRLGTPVFAHLARGAFVAMEWLRSLVRIDVLDQSHVDGFLGGLCTVTRRLTDDAALMAAGDLAWPVFLERYGHLRPGTYEITSPCYADLLDETSLVSGTLSSSLDSGGCDSAFDTGVAPTAWSAPMRRHIEAALDRIGVPLDFTSFESFLRSAIEGREYAKFAFTRNLSAALEDLARLGESVGLDRDQLSHVRLADLLVLRRETGARPGPWLQARAEEGRRSYQRTLAVELPSLVFGPGDLWAFSQVNETGNFVTTASVRARVVEVGAGPAGGDVTGAIVLIPSADPGYDWLFTRGISGLITAYGGANSHMTVRAAERGLPAAIGIGPGRYESLLRARTVELNCGARTIEVVL